MDIEVDFLAMDFDFEVVSETEAPYFPYVEYDELLAEYEADILPIFGGGIIPVTVTMQIGDNYEIYYQTGEIVMVGYYQHKEIVERNRNRITLFTGDSYQFGEVSTYGFTRKTNTYYREYDRNGTTVREVIDGNTYREAMKNV